jgi:alanine racemase
VLPIGYADGYSRRLSNRGSVLIQGRRAPIVGLVCMDMIMVDVTDLAQLQVGETAILIGQQGQESIWADEVANWIGTIPYEVLCAIGSRVPRLYESD